MKNPAVLFNTSSVKAPQNSKNEDTDEKQYHTVVPLLIKEMVVNLPNKVTKYLTTQIVVQICLLLGRYEEQVRSKSKFNMNLIHHYHIIIIHSDSWTIMAVILGGFSVVRLSKIGLTYGFMS